MSIGRNERCPCKSGKKFKNCCINDPKYTATQANNGIPRKYMSEFALHTFSSKVNIVYPKLLETVDVSNPCLDCETGKDFFRSKPRSSTIQA